MSVDYRLCTLYSGSEGNATYIETHQARILIDAGRCARTLISSLKSIGVDIDTVDAIFITHEHMDHIASLEVLTKKHPIPVHLLYKCALRYKDTQPEALCACLRMYQKAEDVHVTIGNVQVQAFATPHDSRASVGYRLTVTEGDESVCIGYATDIGYVSPTVREGLMGCHTVVLESNHDEEMLKNGLYPYDLKVRILSNKGHLSNRDCADFACELYGGGMRELLLAHLSEHNNVPDIAYDEVSCALMGLGVHIAVASPIEVTMLVGDPNCPIPKSRCKEAVI